MPMVCIAIIRKDVGTVAISSSVKRYDVVSGLTVHIPSTEDLSAEALILVCSSIHFAVDNGRFVLWVMLKVASDRS